MQHWNKNHAHIKRNQHQYYYKQQHFDSHAADHNKRGALIGTWTRMRDNTNDDTLLLEAIQQKFLELRILGHPKGHIAKTLAHMRNRTGSGVWTSI